MNAALRSAAKPARAVPSRGTALERVDKPALLALADGTVFRGQSFGADGEVGG